jgi:hypothetical protein
LELVEHEFEKMRDFKDTDEFIDFLESTKRNYSVKVHKTMNIRAEINAKKAELESSKCHN